MSNDKKECWSCFKEIFISEIVCGFCKIPQKPYPQDPFSLFGIEPQFDLNWQQVEERYFTLLKNSHPDRFITAVPEVKSYAKDWSSQLNQAYQVLKDPLSRADALLKKFNVVAHDSEDQQILADVFGWREILLDGNKEEQAALKEELLNIQNQCVNDIVQSFNKKDYLAVSPLIKRLSYAQKCLDELS